MKTKTEGRGTDGEVSDKGMAGRDELIREITLRICGSLEIKESLRSAFEYLKEHVPLEALLLFIIDKRLGAIRRIALFMRNYFPGDLAANLLKSVADGSHHCFVPVVAQTLGVGFQTRSNILLILAGKYCPLSLEEHTVAGNAVKPKNPHDHRIICFFGTHPGIDRNPVRPEES